MKISTLNGEIPSKKINYDKRCHKSTIFSNTKNYYQAPLPFQGQKRDTNIYELQQQLCRCNALQKEVV